MKKSILLDVIPFFFLFTFPLTIKNIFYYQTLQTDPSDSCLQMICINGMFIFYFFLNIQINVQSCQSCLQAVRLINDQMSDKEEDSQQRKYIGLIEKVGSCHNYQYIIFVIMAAINILEAAVIFMLPYLLHQSSYQCAGIPSDECTKKVCLMKISQRNRYLTTPPPFFSLADQLGDFRCERNNQLTAIQSLPFLGALVGMFIFSLFTQKLGRKHSLLISMGLSLLGMVIIFFSKNIQMVEIGVFITFMGTQNALQFTPCYGTEVVSQKWRPLFITLIFFANGVGIMLNSLTYYSIKDWRTVFLFFYIVPVIAVIVGIVYYVQKTPIDLLATENTENIIGALNRIATKNGVQNPDLQQEQIQSLRLEYNSQSKEESFNIIDLCKFASLRKIIIPLVIANFVSNYLFYAPSFIQDSQNTDLFLDNIISGISNMLSCLFVFFALKLLQRRKTQFFLCLFISLIALCMTLPFIKENVTLKSIFYFLFRLVLSVQDNIIFVLNFQSFPTQIRATAGMMCYISGELAGVAQPWAIKFFERYKININSTFVVFGLINFFTACFFKQTFGAPPQQIIQELHQLQNSKQFNDELEEDVTASKKVQNRNYSKLAEFQQ